jgi:hypothetical protein
VLVCSERRVLLTGCWWLVCSEKYCWLVADDKPSEQSASLKNVHTFREQKPKVGSCWRSQACSSSSLLDHKQANKEESNYDPLTYHASYYPRGWLHVSNPAPSSFTFTRFPSFFACIHIQHGSSSLAGVDRVCAMQMQ